MRELLVRVEQAALLLVLCGVTALAVVASDGALGPALVPALAALLFVACVRLPLRYAATGVIFVALLFHNPGGQPHSGEWKGPLYGVGVVLFNNLRLLLPVDFLRFSTLELLFALLLLVALARWLVRADRSPPVLAAPMRLALVVSLASVLAMVAFGMLRGGDFRQALWQARQLGWVPVLGLLFGTAFQTAQARRLLGRMVIAAAMLRAIDGLYFQLAYVGPKHLEVPYILTHEDSVLFAVTLVLLFARVLEQPSSRTVALAGLCAAVVVPALVLNNRRLAYVSLLCSLVATLHLLRPALRRSVLALLLLASPLVAAYTAAGWSSHHVFFAPVASLRSVDDASNRSNQARDDENFNLIHTLRRSPVLGTGFGHPYDEVRKGDSITAFMTNYRYIAHNSVLALWMLTGLLGFVLIWLFVPVTVFLAARAYRAASEPDDRLAALACVTVVIAYFVQAYGDMGVTGWMAAILLAAASGVAGTLAVETHAYPGRNSS